MTGSARGIQSIEVGGRILRALVEKGEAMMLKDLAQAADLAPAQCHAYLASLRHVGLVHQNTDSGLYQMGPFAMRLGVAWLRSDKLASTAVRTANTLSAEMGLMSLVAIWGAQGPTIVHISEGVAPMALNLRQGTLYSVSGTATGRVFAAFGDQGVVGPRIAQEYALLGSGRSLGTKPERAVLDALIQQVRQRGYAIAAGAPIPGVNAISAPVRDEQGNFHLVISLLGPQSMLAVDDGAPAISRLVEASANISGLHVKADSSIRRFT